MNSAIPSAGPVRRAVEHLDKVLADKPEKNGHELSATLQCLGEFRDGLVGARRRQPGDPFGALIEPLNGVISSILAAQYPIGEVRWEQVTLARDWLSGVAEGLSGAE